MNQTIDRTAQRATCDRTAALWLAMRSMKAEIEGMLNHLSTSPDDTETRHELALLHRVYRDTVAEYWRLVR